VPFKMNADRRHHIPRQRHRVTNWAEYDAALRQRGSLTVWFTDAAIAAWRAASRTTRGGQPYYSALAITTALTLRAVFRLALRQTEGLIRSVIRLLGLDLAVPDHSTLSRRAATLPVLRPRSSSEPMHLLVDSTGLRLCGPGEWLVEKHGERTRRCWRKLHLGVDADTGEIVAADVTSNDVDDGSQVGPLLDQVARPAASFTGDGAFDRDDVYGEVVERHPAAAVIVPPRSSAVLSETAPTQRDRHLQLIAERGRMGWQKASGYNWRALIEADIRRYKRVIGDALRSHTDARRATEVVIAVRALNRMLELGRPESVRIACPGECTASMHPRLDPCNTVPARAFFEWRKAGPGDKQPFAVARIDGMPMAFARLWESRRGPDAQSERSFAIITTDANPDVADLHDRMPVIVESADWRVWLGEVESDPAVIAGSADLLAAAERPVIIAGDAVVHSSADEASARLAELIGAPVHLEDEASTLPLPPQYPLFRGPLVRLASHIRGIRRTLMWAARRVCSSTNGWQLYGPPLVADDQLAVDSGSPNN
jgi:DDE family transposase/SOS response associated peptidase (SRAP)